MAGLSVRSLVWSAFRRGGLVSVSVVFCRRSPSRVALSFVFRSRVVALGFLRRWRGLAGGAFSVLVPVAGAVPFVGSASQARPGAFVVAGGVAALPALVSSLSCALL